MGADEGAGVVLLESELRVLVDAPPDGDQPFLVLVRRTQQLLRVVVRSRGSEGRERQQED